MTTDAEFLPIPGFPGYRVARDLRVMGPRGLLTQYDNGCVALRFDGKQVQRTPPGLLKLALGISKPPEPEQQTRDNSVIPARLETVPGPDMPLAVISAARSEAQKKTVPLSSGAYYKMMRQNEELWRENQELREEIDSLQKLLAHNDALIVNLAGRLAVQSVGGQP